MLNSNDDSVENALPCFEKLLAVVTLDNNGCS